MWRRCGGEKIFSALLFSAVGIVVFLVLGTLISIFTGLPLMVMMGIALGSGLAFGYASFRSPDSLLASAASRRQRELSLEMGYRISRAARRRAGRLHHSARHPQPGRAGQGGPFVEELRRAATILDITKDDMLAMDQMIDRNDGNELLAEFANSIKMVSRQGGQISPILNVLADQAQQHLRLNIQGQARKNLQEMTRPIGISCLVVHVPAHHRPGPGGRAHQHDDDGLLAGRIGDAQDSNRR